MKEKMEASLLRPLNINGDMFLEYQNPDPDKERVIVPFDDEPSLYARAELVRAAFCQINGRADEEELKKTLEDTDRSMALRRHIDTLKHTLRRGVWVVFFEDRPLGV